MRIIAILFVLLLLTAPISFVCVRSINNNYKTEQKLKLYVIDKSYDEMYTLYSNAKNGDAESAWRLSILLFLAWAHPQSIETIDDELQYLANYWLDKSVALGYPYAIIDTAVGINGVFEEHTNELLSNRAAVKDAVNQIISKQRCNKVDLWYKYVIYSQLDEFRDAEKATYWKNEYENNHMN